MVIWIIEIRVKRECGVLLAFWAAGERLEVLAAVTHTEVPAFVRLYNVCAVIEVAEETARLYLWTQRATIGHK